jgi:copper homeostasis protein
LPGRWKPGDLPRRRRRVRLRPAFVEDDDEDDDEEMRKVLAVMPILLETIVSSLDDARAARAGGADRFELCSALALGGLTPSLGTLAAIKAELAVPVMFMVRPREGGMAYTGGEFAVMERDAALALAAGADGLVFGFLTPTGAVDTARCRRFIAGARRRAGGRPVQFVFHRAFDVVAEPATALEQLVELGCTRLLTSGRAPLAVDGAAEIRRTVEQAAGRIEVLPGGGLRAGNVADLVRATGVNQVHLSITAPAADPSAAANPAVRFGGADPLPTELEYRAVDEAGVRQVKEILAALESRWPPQ